MCRRRDDAFSPRFFANSNSFASARQSRRSSPSLTRIDWSGFAQAISNAKLKTISNIGLFILSPGQFPVTSGLGISSFRDRWVS